MEFHQFMVRGKLNVDMETKKKQHTQKAKGLLLRKNSPFKNIPILGTIL